MIINDFDIIAVIVNEMETYAPLIIDSDAILTLSISS